MKTRSSYRIISLCVAAIVVALVTAGIGAVELSGRRSITGKTRPTLKVSRVSVAQAKSSTKAKKPTKYVAITFDDGPSNYTPRILSILKKKGAKATFFTLGSQVKSHSSTARRIVNEGNQIALHSYNHRDFTKLSAAKIRADVNRTRAIVKRTTGVDSNYFRPPYGAQNRKVTKTLKAMHMRKILWDKDTRDWARPGASKIIARATKKVKNGDIILMHDGGGNRNQTVRALPTVIDRLHAQGFELVTVQELYKLGLR